ncbi:MAG: hypothetical protein J6A96_03355 [Clostridia bacterium]|nr:hypothetical protein [Clostridia bacterium]
MKNKLLNYSIMPLDTDHIDEICADIKEQYETGVATCALFQMTLVPEGNPPRDKVSILCKKYSLFRDKLSSMGFNCGVLVQASVGHGWTLGEKFPYQSHVNFNDGKSVDSVCPCDEDFKDYIYNVMRAIAIQNPECIMIDDDFRLIWYKGEGCACPLHMARFNEKAGVSLTRKELWDIVNKRTELSKKYTDIYIETQRDSLLETAKIMRQGVDSVNPKLPMSYCCCGNNAEFAYEIASVLAGEGNPITVRINNGNYTPQGARYLSRVFQRAATQIAKLKDKVDVILAETDTCPQNRYSTGAMSLHTHFTGSILEGATGAKHWITRLITYEPDSGKAYRRILSKYNGFYEKLAELTPSLKWRGCRIHTPKAPDFTYGRVKEESDGWSYCVLERLGIPMYFSGENGGVLCLEGDSDSWFTDSEVLELLKGSVFLASNTAKNLINRGFGKYLGVDVREWTGKPAIRERICINGGLVKAQMQTKELVPLSPNTKIDSYALNTVDHESYEELFAGSTIYKNELGGTVFTFCGTPVADFNISDAFSFLSYSRKEQLVNMLKTAGELPIYYKGDEEVYLKCADTQDGELFCALFNIGLDPIEKIELECEFAPTKIECLTPNGEREELSFTLNKKDIIISKNANTQEPVILFLSK